MKQLELKGLQVTEMSFKEMTTENGGGWLEWAIEVVSDIIDDPEGFGKGINDGANRFKH